MTRNLIFALFGVLYIAILVNAGGLYTVIGPGTIRSNFKYTVAVSVHKADGPSKIKVGITGPSYNETKEIEVDPMSTKNVDFDVPTLKDGDYNLTAVGLSGVTFENSTKLNYGDYKPLNFIQTDKATYKPGDLVQYRVIFLDANTRPAKIDKPITILINDGAQNRIKQLKDVKLTKGVYSDKFQLSEQPVLGEWNIEVLVDDENPERKTFEVAKYVLPKFDVSIETAKDVAVADGVIKITVRSKYTYGKSVKGKATISIKPTYGSLFEVDVNSNETPKYVKTIDVDGKGHVEFDMKNDLSINSDRSYLPPLNVLAIMEEELTGNKQNTTTQINVHQERYRIEGVETPNNYHPGKPVVFVFVVKNLDGSPVQDKKNKAKLIVEPPHNYIYRGFAIVDGLRTTEQPNEKPLEIESELNENGMAKFEFTLPETNHSYYSIRCSFLETKTYLSSLSKYTPTRETAELLKIDVKTKKPKLGKDVAVEISSSEVLPYFVYTIVARNNIVKTEHVDVPDNRKSHLIKFTPTFEMIPKARIYVHYVFNNDLRFQELSIDFEKDFENMIDIETQPQAKPGEDVKLKINTDPESFVGLLGVDQSVLLLKSGNDFDKEKIFEGVNKFESSTPSQRGYGRYPGQSTGVVTLTNANYPYNDDRWILYSQHIGFTNYNFYQFMPIPGGAVGVPGPAAPAMAFYSPMPNPLPKIQPIIQKIRKEFPENWIFENLQNTDKDGFTLVKKIPDTITSWVITGFSLNPTTGFALTEQPTKIKVFQPFFVSTNLPYSVKRGEVIAIPVIIFNYMEKNLDAEVTMDNTDKEFEFTEATNEIEEQPIDEIKRVKRVTIPSNTGKSVSFMIRPNKVGSITLKINAVTPLAGDAIHKQLKVEPEGITQYANRAVFVNLKDKSEQNEKLTVDVPKEAVPDSEYIEFSVVGDLLGPTIKNLDKLVRMPYGCGEQNMVNFVPNILVLKYLDTIDKNMPTIVEKAKKFLEIGYQRELTYKHDDGSYSAFGKSDKAGSTWLTAYVVRSFHQAINYTDIDPKIILEGLDFLASKQAENGSFPEYGKLFDSSHQNELGLTSFVILAFLENVEHIPKYKSNIDKGLKYIYENAEKSDDLYSLSIAAYAIEMSKEPAPSKVLAKVQSLAKQEDNRKWWSKSSEPEPKEKPWYWHPHSNDVEITSYILLAILSKEEAETTLPIVKWLIAQRNSNGGFASTQDTVIGLQALIKFAEKTGSASGEMDIEFVSTGGEETKGKINVNPDNSLVLQTHVLPKSTRQVDFSAKGKRSAMVQLSYRYNMADKNKKPSFKVNTTVKDKVPPQQLILEVCSEFVPIDDNKDKKESNMAILEVALPSGYTADTDSFTKIESVDRVKRTETKNSDSTVIVYFEGLGKNEITCVPVEASKTHAVAKQKPASVSIYDYYETGARATEFYEVKSSLCDICEGEDCGAGCKK